MKRTISVGVIGCGYWGPNLLRNFRSLPNVRVKAVCDLNQERLQHLKSLYPEVELHSDYRQLLGPDGEWRDYLD